MRNRLTLICGFMAAIVLLNKLCTLLLSRSQWPCGLKRRSAAAHLLSFWVRIPAGAWMFVVSALCCQVEVSASGWSLVQRSPTDWCVAVCDLETSWMRRPWPTEGCHAKNKQTNNTLNMSALSYLKIKILSSCKNLKRHKNSPSVFHACRNRRLKWIQGVREYNWTILPPGDINTETRSSNLLFRREADPLIL